MPSCCSLLPAAAALSLPVHPPRWGLRCEKRWRDSRVVPGEPVHARLAAVLSKSDRS